VANLSFVGCLSWGSVLTTSGPAWAQKAPGELDRAAPPPFDPSHGNQMEDTMCPPRRPDAFRPKKTSGLAARPRRIGY
jgi:hypothetical protein